MPKTTRNPAGQSRRVDAPIDEMQADLLCLGTAIVSGSAFESVVMDRGPSRPSDFTRFCESLLTAIGTFNADRPRTTPPAKPVHAEPPVTHEVIEEVNAKLRAQVLTTPSPAAFERYIAHKPTHRKKPIPE